jgi:hypothetical protein
MKFVGSLVLFLASGYSNYITDATMNISDGLLMDWVEYQLEIIINAILMT